MTISIRTAELEDARGIARVHVDSFVDSYQRFPTTHRSAREGLDRRIEEWRGLLASQDARQMTLVAVADGTVRGFVRVGPSPDDQQIGHVFSIHVSPDATGEGMGTRLMDEAVSFLRHAGFGTATLWVVADNEVACRFYERMGWRREDIERMEKLAFGTEDGDLVDLVRYRLDLEGEG